MARVITFSRVFPSYHPRAGQPTYFVEKIWNGFRDDCYCLPQSYAPFVKEYVDIKREEEHLHFAGLKYTTIRAGHRWKVGDWFSPRVWSGIPYRSKQIQFAPDIQIKKVWDFKMDLNGVYSINGEYVLEDEMEDLLSKNDGLCSADMFNWLMKNWDKPNEFDGQIICWNENIEY